MAESGGLLVILTVVAMFVFIIFTSAVKVVQEYERGVRTIHDSRGVHHLWFGKVCGVIGQMIPRTQERKE